METILKNEPGEGLQRDASLAALASARLFADLPEPVLKAIATATVERRLRAGETLFTLGQYDGQEFYYVVSGRLKVARASSKGAMLIERAGKGEFFGLAAAVAGAVEDTAASATMTADEDSFVLCVESAPFRAVVAQRPSLAKSLMQHFAAALVAAPNWREEDAAPERRIFAALMEHVERDAVSGEWRIARMPKHKELAEKAGTEEADVAAAVARLIQNGAARRDYPGLVIVDMQSLTRLAS
jgi:CRP-like cAMP-binding protein